MIHAYLYPRLWWCSPCQNDLYSRVKYAATLNAFGDPMPIQHICTSHFLTSNPRLSKFRFAKLLTCLNHPRYDHALYPRISSHALSVFHTRSAHYPHLRSIVEEVKLPPVPMSMLCLMCFAEDSKACFDGNFQLTTLGEGLRNSMILEDFHKGH